MTDFEFTLIVRSLMGEATDYEQGKLKEWLREGDNRVQYEEFKAIWIKSGEVYNNYVPDLRQARERIQNGIDATVDINLWKWVRRAAAILVVAVGLLWIVVEYSATEDFRQLSMEEISTGSALDSVVLSDGSIVWLNKETTLKFPKDFTGSERRVFLSGEAFFEVAHNTKMPFIIESRGTVIRVLGTSFNVKSSPDHVSVAVRTGTVLFSEHANPKNFELLTKNEMAAFDRANRSMKRSTIDGVGLPSWRNHQLVFENAPLSEVMNKISDYYGVTVHLDPALPHDLSLTASFEEQDIEEVLGVVCATLDLRFECSPEGYRLSAVKK